MKCSICGNENKACFSGVVLGKYVIDYFHCSSCDFVQTETPYWLDEAYSRSINLSDTGYMSRNVFYAKRISVLLFLLFDKKAKFLDYAGGYGVFVRLMRDIGFDFTWDDKYTKNIFSAGFEWDQKSQVDAVTLFEAFEHFVDPLSEIGNLLGITDTIIFSTEMHPEPVPLPHEWWYYGLDHGQHISFYSKQTLVYIADKLGLNYYNVGSLHILSKKIIPRWILYVTRMSRFGLSMIVMRTLESKTQSDYDVMSKKI